MNILDLQNDFFRQLANPHVSEEVFDEIGDTVYFIKDEAGRYVTVNETLVRRCGKTTKEDLIGKTAREVFPVPLGEDFTRQDLALLAGGPDIRSRLELHLYPGGESGWCLTWKKALRRPDGRTIGLSGISRDLSSSVESAEDLRALSQLLEHISAHLSESLSLRELAEATGLSPFQIGQRMKRVFGLSPHQYIIRCRIEVARHELSSSRQSLAEIALSCGFSDQSAFTRQFKRSVGMTPKAYRDQKT